jgi:hypothetical protein
MKASLIKTENIDFLDELFPQFTPQLSKIEFVGIISVFSFFFETENLLNDNWEPITSSIGSYYQSELDDEESEFERWNIYILFIVKEPVNIQLKYKIENDKFSSRKIVQENFTHALNTDGVSELIAKHILNSDLSISELNDSQTSERILTYSSDSKIYRLIEAKMPDKSTAKEGIETLYQQIKNEIQNEIQKSRNTSI